jgi:hypothetical protein
LIVAGVIGWPIAGVLGLTTAQVTEWWGPVITVILMAIVVLALGWYVLHGWNREIILYERGFSYREGSNTVFFRYNEVASIRLRAERLAYFGGLLRRNIYRFTVTTTEEERFTITNLYLRAAELGTKLTEQINRVLQPLIAQKIANGEAVAFGDTLTLKVDGLHEAGRALSWDDYGGYQVGGHRLALLDRTGAIWYMLPLPEVDNITLLVELLREHAVSTPK